MNSGVILAVSTLQRSMLCCSIKSNKQLQNSLCCLPQPLKPLSYIFTASQKMDLKIKQPELTEPRFFNTEGTPEESMKEFLAFM